MKVISCVIVFLAFAVLAWGSVMRHTDCGSSAIIHFVVIEQCNHDPCIFVTGQNYTILISYTPTETHTEVHSSMSISYPLRADVPVPVWTNYRCNILSTLCPIRKGLVQTYSANFQGPVSTEPTMSMKWEIKDEHGDHIVCFVMAELSQSN